jgi:hypothetical protein
MSIRQCTHAHTNKPASYLPFNARTYTIAKELIALRILKRNIDLVATLASPRAELQHFLGKKTL